MLHCIAVGLQGIARSCIKVCSVIYCVVLQFIAVHGSVLQCIAMSLARAGVMVL